MKVIAMETAGKGKQKITFDNQSEMILYRGEYSKYKLKQGMELSEELYQELYWEVYAKRVTKRAMFLLEKMDRSEAGLRTKLKENAYPEDLIDNAIEYVKKYKYIDDLRYAKTYVRYHGVEKSAGRLRQDLMRKGISKEFIEEALEEEFVFDEIDMIRKLMEKKHFNPQNSSRQEQSRMYRFLAQRGFKSSNILSVMKCTEYLT